MMEAQGPSIRFSAQINLTNKSNLQLMVRKTCPMGRPWSRHLTAASL